MTRVQDNSFKYPAWLWISFIALSFIKIWLVSSQGITALGHAIYDDRLFLNNAKYLLNGAWLGPYYPQTLAKGPFYPMWIAAVFKLGLPLLLTQHIFYILSCLLFVSAIRPLLGSRTLALWIFIVLLFNPMSYTTGVMTQVLREGIYPALVIFVISCGLGLLARFNCRLSTILPWSLGLGAALSAFWLTREEGVWIVPFVFMCIGFILFTIRRDSSVIWKKLSFILLPFIIWVMAVGGVAGINKIKYGIFVVSELKTNDFLAAYGALSRVKHAAWKPTIPVPEDVIEQVYKVSPAFSELRPFLSRESDIGRRWYGIFKNVRETMRRDPEFAKKINAYLKAEPSGIWSKALEDDSGVHGGWFVWFFREAVASAGYHASGNIAADYYRRLANEVNAACADGRLVCGSERGSMMPPWRSEYNYPLMKEFIYSVVYLAGFRDFQAIPDPSYGDEESLKLFKEMTRGRLSPSQFRLRGWIVSPEKTVNISIRAAEGNVIRPLIPYLPSPDVYQIFLARGMDIPKAGRARFDAEGEITGEFSPCRRTCYMYIESGGQLIKKMPLDGSLLSVNDPDLHLQLEFVGLKDNITKKDSLKLSVLGWIGAAYQYSMPFLSVLAFFVYALNTIVMAEKHVLSSLWLINTLLLIALASRLFVLSVIHVTSFTTIIPHYLSPCYPLLLMFVFLSVSGLFSQNKEKTVQGARRVSRVLDIFLPRVRKGASIK